ncbi:MAG TPA: PEP-CTERM sorting domain-containing protein [Planctomycetota bacterium]|nr:PEP-CTERM sorting domain-containing protein [Planctomycetota bacterium]HRR79454.1 PEP-CTERM sorting domain-containing protein [Planctomycetota bacterium]
MRSSRLVALAILFAIAVLGPSAQAGPYPGWDLRMIDVTSNPNALPDTVPYGDSAIGGPYPGGLTVTFDNRVHYSSPDWGTGGNYGINSLYPSGTNSTDSFMLKASADVTIPAGTWTVGWGSDDGGMLRINDPSVVFTTRYGTYYDAGWPAEPGNNTVSSNQWRGHTWTGGTFTLAAPLSTTMDVFMFEGGGGDSLEIGMASGTVTGVLPLLVNGLNGWSITGNVAPTQPVTYRIQGGSASGNASVTGYLSSSQAAAGTQFMGPVAGNPATATGVFNMPENTLQYVHIDASGVPGAGSPPNSPWLEVTLTAPVGWIFTQTGNQYLTTNAATWTPLSDPWGNVQTLTLTPYNIAAPSPPSSGHAPGAQAIWAWDDQGNALTREYWEAAATITQGAWSVIQPPDQGVNQPAGLSAHIVRVDSNLDNLSQVDAALNLRKNQPNHSVSQAFVGANGLARADFDTEGNFGTPVGFLPGDQHSGGANPEDYAMRVTAYIQTTSPNETWTFAVSGDNRFYFNVGGIEFARSESVVGASPILAPMIFPTPGYYPLSLVWGNRDGAGGWEISYAPGIQSTFSTGTFSVLGTGALPVFQNPAALGNMANVGANDLTGAVYTGAITPAADGFRVQQAFPGVAMGNVSQSIAYYADKIIQNGNTTLYNVGGVAVTPITDFHDSGGTGNFNYNNPLPANTAADDDNYATRINGLVYIPAPGTYGVAVGTDDSFYLRVGNQVLGRFDGGRGLNSGTANYMYASFAQAGLYPLEFYHHEGGGGSGIEISFGGNTSLILPSTRNPAGNGYTPDWTGFAYAVTPVAELQAEVLTIKGKAFGLVPALGNLTVNPEKWQLFRQRQVDQVVPGLMGIKYNRTNGNPWDDTWPVIAQEMFFVPPSPYTVFNIPDGAGYGFQTNTQGDNIGARWIGYLNFPSAGNWNFRMDTDDISWIFIDIDGDYDIPGPGYHIFEPGEAAPGNQAWTVIWNGVNIPSPGLRRVEFRSVEGGGGEWTQLQWQGPTDPGLSFIPGSAFSWIWPAGTWELIASGAFDDIGNLLAFEDMMTFDFGTTETLRLQVDIAGLTAVYEGTFLFVPEPGTMLLLAGGLLAAATRRRRNRR